MYFMARYIHAYIRTMPLTWTDTINVYTFSLSLSLIVHGFFDLLQLCSMSSIIIYYILVSGDDFHISTMFTVRIFNQPVWF